MVLELPPPKLEGGRRVLAWLVDELPLLDGRAPNCGNLKSVRIIVDLSWSGNLTPQLDFLQEYKADLIPPCPGTTATPDAAKSNNCPRKEQDNADQVAARVTQSFRERRRPSKLRSAA